MNGVLWFILGLILGMLVAFVISWLLWRRWAGERQNRILGLQASLSEKEQDLRSLNKHLQEQKATVVQFRDHVIQGETRIGALEAELDEQKAVASQLLLTVSERDGQIEGLKAGVEEAQAEAGRLAALLEEKEREIAMLRASPQEGATRGGLAVAALSPGAKQDNLQLIEGIGPKISDLLREAGITTFAQLAVTDTSRLEQIVWEANLAMVDPHTWPEQARLAADGQWDALQVLQDELKGGKRV